MTDPGATLPPAARSKDSPFYSPKLDTVSEQARKLLESYSGIEPDHVIKHVEDIVRPFHPYIFTIIHPLTPSQQRDRAWEIVLPPTQPSYPIQNTTPLTTRTGSSPIHA